MAYEGFFRKIRKFHKRKWKKIKPSKFVKWGLPKSWYNPKTGQYDILGR